MKKPNHLTRSIIKVNTNFNLANTLFSGQCFRWSETRIDYPYYSSFIQDTALFIRSITLDKIEVLSSTDTIDGRSITDYLFWYFSLDIDTDKILPLSFRNSYPDVWSRLLPYLGTRIMRQDPFEIMVTFMCAQGIGMHLIRRQVAMITENYGQRMVIETPDSEVFLFRFPAPCALASADPYELARCTNNNRIRAANIIAMARAFDSGKLISEYVQTGECGLENLREALQSYRGIGMKIADCIALFGLGRFDAFPIDTHVKQYLWEWFGIEAARHTLTPKNYRIMQDEARNILGNEYAGYAGHMLFHCWRREIKKMSAF